MGMVETSPARIFACSSKCSTQVLQARISTPIPPGPAGPRSPENRRPGASRPRSSRRSCRAAADWRPASSGSSQDREAERRVAPPHALASQEQHPPPSWLCHGARYLSSNCPCVTRPRRTRVGDHLADLPDGLALGGKAAGDLGGGFRRGGEEQAARGLGIEEQVGKAAGTDGAIRRRQRPPLREAGQVRRGSAPGLPRTAPARRTAGRPEEAARQRPGPGCRSGWPEPSRWRGRESRSR